MADLKEINSRQIRNNIAYYLYEQARKERLLPDGTYEPNWKVINQKSYTEYRIKRNCFYTIFKTKIFITYFNTIT